jgi:hypothetical protein
MCELGHGALAEFVLYPIMLGGTLVHFHYRRRLPG